MRIVIFLFVLFLSGCGYHAVGSADDWVGGESRVLYVKLFENRTPEPYLENFMTDALVAELSRSRVVVLTEDAGRAEVTLVGHVEGFSSKSLAHGASDRITDYRATMKVSAQLIRKEGGEVLWKNAWQRSEDYPATAVAVDKSLQLDGERLSARLVSQRLAEDIHASLLSRF